MGEVLTGLCYYEHTMTLPFKFMRLYSQMSTATDIIREVFCVCLVGRG